MGDKEDDKWGLNLGAIMAIHTEIGFFELRAPI